MITTNAWKCMDFTNSKKTWNWNPKFRIQWLPNVIEHRASWQFLTNTEHHDNNNFSRIEGTITFSILKPLYKKNKKSVLPHFANQVIPITSPFTNRFLLACFRHPIRTLILRNKHKYSQKYDVKIYNVESLIHSWRRYVVGQLFLITLSTMLWPTRKQIKI